MHDKTLVFVLAAILSGSFGTGGDTSHYNDVTGVADDVTAAPDSGPSFDPSTPAKVTAVAGKAAYLTCRVFNTGNKTVSWIRHKDLAILSSGQKTYAQDSRVSLFHKPSSAEWVLKIRYVQPRDAGVYGCQLPTRPLSSRPIQLRVVVPETSIVGEQEMFVDISSTINLTCTVRYSPEPAEYVFWYHNHAVLTYSSPPGRVTVRTERAVTTASYLLIHSARVTDSGLYTCSPSNADAASVKVHVLEEKRPAGLQTNRGSPPLSAGSVLQLTSIAWTVAATSH